MDSMSFVSALSAPAVYVLPLEEQRAFLIAKWNKFSLAPQKPDGTTLDISGLKTLEDYKGKPFAFEYLLELKSHDGIRVPFAEVEFDDEHVIQFKPCYLPGMPNFSVDLEPENTAKYIRYCYAEKHE